MFTARGRGYDVNSVRGCMGDGWGNALRMCVGTGKMGWKLGNNMCECGRGRASVGVKMSVWKGEWESVGE